MAKTAIYEERVNTSFIGFILIGFLLLLIGVMGLQFGNLFGDDVTKWPISSEIFSSACSILGVILLLLTVFAYRTGEKTSAALFAAFGFSALLIGVKAGVLERLLDTSNWFMYVAIAIIFLVFAIYSILEEEPRLVSFLFIVLAVMFFFMGLACYFNPGIAVDGVGVILAGPGADLNAFRAMAIVYSIFGFIGFVLTVYLGLAYSQPKKLPLI